MYKLMTIELDVVNGGYCECVCLDYSSYIAYPVPQQWTVDLNECIAVCGTLYPKAEAMCEREKLFLPKRQGT